MSFRMMQNVLEDPVVVAKHGPDGVHFKEVRVVFELDLEIFPGLNDHAEVELGRAGFEVGSGDLETRPIGQRHVITLIEKLNLEQRVLVRTPFWLQQTDQLGERQRLVE